MNQPFISVIIPTHNRKVLCRRAVASVLAQTYSYYEIIVVDDGSNDGTCYEYLFGAYSSHCHFIKLTLNSGVSKARNRGIAQARGSWIAFLDSDDEWLPRKLERQAQWIMDNPQIAIVQTREMWIRNGRRVNPPLTHEKKSGDIFGESLKRCMITPSSVMIQSSLFQRVGVFNESLPACEDYDLWLRLTYRYNVGLLDECLLKRYGGHDDQLSSTIPILDTYRIRSLLHLLTHEHLSPSQKDRVVQTLRQKIIIVTKGFKKRKKTAEYERYTNIAHIYRFTL